MTAWNPTESCTGAEEHLDTQARTTSDCAAGSAPLPVSDRASMNLSLLYGGAPAKSTIRPSELLVARPA